MRNLFNRYVEIITSQLKLQITPLPDIKSSKYCVTLWHSLLLMEQISKIRWQKDAKYNLSPGQNLDRLWSGANISKIYEGVYRSASK